MLGHFHNGIPASPINKYGHQIIAEKLLKVIYFVLRLAVYRHHNRYTVMLLVKNNISWYIDVYRIMEIMKVEMDIIDSITASLIG